MLILNIFVLQFIHSVACYSFVTIGHFLLRYPVLHDTGAHNTSSEYLSDKQFLRSVNKRLPKFYNDKLDQLAWECYKSGIEAEKREDQLDLNKMFDIDDIEEPERLDLNAKIEDEVWNCD